MREIKFRVWDARSKKMFYDVQPFGALWNVSLTSGGVGQQFIGLKDKNGKDIYEDDIVRAYQYVSMGDDPEDRELDEFTLHRVCYRAEDDYPAFDLVPTSDEEANGIASYLTTPDYSLEVVGNVHENEELLKELVL